MPGESRGAQWARANPEKHAERARRYRAAHPEKHREAQRKYVEANPEVVQQRARERRARIFQEMVEAYGGKCSCCGESNPMFLTVEHVGGRTTGAELRNTYKELVRLKKAGWPSSCTCLCYNCNCGSARNGGVCPHQMLVAEEVR